MIAHLQGKLVEKSPTQVVIDCGGVGYDVNISLHTYSLLPNTDFIKLYTHLQIKEDAHTLFGFFEREEKEMFLLLISVSGVGAATARMMLSSLKSEEVRIAILQGNIKLLETVKGIGKKSAERLVLELKDKISKHPSGADFVLPANNSFQQDALTALTALGISRQQAELSIQKIIRAEPSITQLEDLIKKALKAI